MKQRYFAILLFTACFLGLYIWCSSITVHFPYMGIELVEKDRQWYISALDKEGLGKGIGLKLGDHMVQVDGQDPVRNLVIQKWADIEQVHWLRVDREGQTVEIHVDHRVNPYDSRFFFLSSALGIFSFGLAIFLWLKAYGYPSAKSLAFVYFAVSLIFISLGASSRGDALGKFIVYNTVMVLPVLFIHFILAFIREKSHDTLSVKPLPFAEGVLSLFFLARFSYFTPFYSYLYFQYDRFITLLSFSIGLLINLVLLFIVSLCSRKGNPYLSAIMKNVWIILFLSFSPVIALSIVPDILFGDPWVNYFYTTSFAFLLPILFLYLIFSHQLFNVHILLQRIFFLFSLSVVPAFLIAGLFFPISHEHFQWMRWTQFFLITSVTFAFMFYLLNRFRNRFEFLLFPKKYQMQIALHQIVNQLKNINSFRGIEEKILVEIMNTLDVKGAAILFDHREGREMIAQGSLQGADLVKLLHADRTLRDLYSVFVIHQETKHSSSLIITNKKIRFTKEEMDWLDLVIKYLSVVLENVYLIQKLTMKVEELFQKGSKEQELQEMRWLRKMIFQLQEKDRERIASDLHDTVMQDIYFAKQRLGYLQQQADKWKLAKDLADTAEHLDVINFHLRETCFNLYPLLLKDSGLVYALQNLIKNEKRRAPFQIQLHLDETSVLEQVDMEIKSHIFRIVQELLTNAKKHSQATSVSFSCYLNKDVICLEYQDNGIGFHEGMEQSGLGLLQIKNRIYSLKGRIHMVSEFGQGVRMTIEIPRNRK